MAIVDPRWTVLVATAALGLAATAIANPADRALAATTERPANASSEAPSAEAPQTAALLRQLARTARDGVHGRVQPALLRTAALAEAPGVAAAIAAHDGGLLRRIANEEMRRGATGVDCIAFVNAKGRVVATSTLDANGEALPAERIRRLDGLDLADRAIIGSCLASSSDVPIAEFQLDCEFTRILWDSVGLSMACSAPVRDSSTGERVGAVTTRMRFDRLAAPLREPGIDGIELVMVDARGRIMSEEVQRGERACSVSERSMAAVVASLAGPHVTHSTVSVDRHLVCAFPVADLRTTSGGGASVVAIASPDLLAAETSSGRLATTATVGAFAVLASLSGALLVQSRRQRRSQAALVSARNEADAASRAKTEFLANMSHEIRTPMTAILGYVDLLADHGDAIPGAPSREEAVDTIRRNARHLLAIINDILDLSKIEAGHMTVDRQRVRTADLAQDVMRLMDDRARQKGIALRLAFDGEVPDSISTDPTRLRQVLINLLGNAVKFTEQGAVTLTVRRQAGEDRVLDFEVSDTGIGMSPEQLSRIYHPFMQADTSTTRRFGGTGLGLAITRRCVDILGGTISVRSAPGTGTAFTVRLEVGDMASTPTASLRAPAATADGAAAIRLPGAVRQPLSGVRVLLAEDGIDNQRLIRFHLELAGARVDIVDNGAKALERVQGSSRMDRHDVILMDMQMPVMDGYEAVRRLVAAGERTPIIALTAHGMVGDREKCMDAGCRDYLCKPVDSRALIAAIRHAIAPGATEVTSLREWNSPTDAPGRPGDAPGRPGEAGSDGAPRAIAG